MIGINNTDGRALGGLAHLRQSVVDILTTPIGSRVIRRDYGSRLFNLVDAPMHKNSMIRIYAAAANALERWEPRLRLSRVIVNGMSADGRMIITLEGEYLPDGQPITMDGIEL